MAIGGVAAGKRGIRTILTLLETKTYLLTGGWD